MCHVSFIVLRLRTQTSHGLAVSRDLADLAVSRTLESCDFIWRLALSRDRLQLRRPSACAESLAVSADPIDPVRSESSIQYRQRIDQCRRCRFKTGYIRYRFNLFICIV